jgi:glucose/arabinose dehydrogenase
MGQPAHGRAGEEERMRRTSALGVLLAVVMGGTGCEPGEGQAESADEPRAASAQEAPSCDADNGGLMLPDGFCAVVVAEGLSGPRHMAVAENGDLYVSLQGGRGTSGAAMVLRDTTGDGKADVRASFDDQGGTGVTFWNDWVYVGHNDGVVRYPRPTGGVAPEGPAEVIVSGLRSQGGHAAKPVQISDAGDLFVNIGSPSNSCQVEDRTTGSPGKDPCDEREANAGIWRFDADTPGQTMADGTRFAAGMRNTVALRLNPIDGELYAAIHGRDQLFQNWGEHYDEVAGAELPSEEFVHVEEGDDFGWPYCYFDHQQGRKVLAPEYGGDGEQVGRCSEMKDPMVGFPGHWAPNGLAFYDGDQFPERYHGGAFIAFHGSWNRAPRPQEGANVVFVPRSGDGFGPDWEVFAEGDGWAENRNHRPAGLAVGPDGSLYISDDAGGTIWRVIHQP